MNEDTAFLKDALRRHLLKATDRWPASLGHGYFFGQSQRRAVGERRILFTPRAQRGSLNGRASSSLHRTYVLLARLQSSDTYVEL